MKDQLKHYLESAKAQYLRLSPRERGIVIAAAAFLIGMVVYGKIYQPIRDKFATQSLELEQAQKDVDVGVSLLSQYIKLKAHRDEIERAYKQVDLEHRELSVLEQIFKNKATAGSEGFAIQNGPVKEFGGNYEQAEFTVSFKTSTLQDVVNFLDEVVHGAKPLVLTLIDLQKSRYGNRLLDAKVEVSSIRRVK